MSIHPSLISLRRTIGLMAVGWTALLLVLAVLEHQRLDRSAEREAWLGARMVSRRDQLLHHSLTGLGLVYAPVTQTRQPDPRLTNTVGRDIETTAGQQLTLVNPVQLARDWQVDVERGGRIQSRITSLKLDTSNPVDLWESNTLKSLAAGVEVKAVEKIDGKPHLRLMTPLVADKSCLSCHVDEGIRVGDVLGGISVRVSLSEYYADARSAWVLTAMPYAFFLAAGLAGLGVSYRALSKHIQKRDVAEKALRDAVNRLRLATQAGRIGIWEYDISGDRLEWDDQMRQIYGVTATATPRSLRAWVECVHAGDSPAMQGAFQQYCQNGDQAHSCEFRIVRKDDQAVRHIRTNAILLRDGNGRPEKVIGSNWDVSGERLREAALRDANCVLEETTAWANKMALQADLANAARGQFITNVSHELRTPMNAVLGMTGLLTETALTPEQRQYTTILNNNGRALMALINDLLDFSNLKQGRVHPDSVESDPREVLEETAQLLSIKAREKGLQLSIDIDPATPARLYIDVNRLRQILLNLGNNAIKFTDAGKIGLSIKLEPRNQQLDVIRFSVTDTGIGIAPDKRAILFSPFTQADGSITRLYGGTGIGLALCKRLVESMRGTIDFESEPGKGSTFWFTLPCRTTKELPGHDTSQVAAAQRARPVSLSLPAGAPSSVAGCRVLVVEDNAANQLLVTKLVERQNCIVDVANNGEEALRILRTQVYRLVLMDCQMPRMGGLEACRLIRSGKAMALDPKVPIVAMTAHATDGDREDCLGAGMDDYLSKPINREDLGVCLKKWLVGTGSSRNDGDRRGMNPSGQSEPDPFASAKAVTPPQEAAAPELSVFNREGFLNTIMDDESLAEKLVTSFLSDVPDQLQRLEESVRAGELALVAQHAHRLKGAAGVVRGMVLHQLAADMEKAALSGDAGMVKSSLPKVQSAFAGLRTHLLAEWPQAGR